MTAPAKIDIAASHQTRIGCSKIAQALGVSQWGTAYQLWECYTNRAPWPDIGNQLRVALGEPMEDVLRPFVAARLGRELRRDRKEYLHGDLPLIGHVDYRASALNGEPRPVVDMKTSLGWGSRNRFGVDGTDEVDDDVLLQMQGYLLLTGAQTAYVAALVPGPELKIFTVHADLEIHTMIAEGLENFWWHVTSDTPPPLTTLEDANRRYSRATHDCKTIDAKTAILLSSYRTLKADIKTKEIQADSYELLIKEAMGEHEALTDDRDRPVCTWKNQTSKRMDTTAFKEAHPDIAAGFVKETTSRVFRLSKEKP